MLFWDSAPVSFMRSENSVHEADPKHLADLLGLWTMRPTAPRRYLVGSMSGHERAENGWDATRARAEQNSRFLPRVNLGKWSKLSRGSSDALVATGHLVDVLATLKQVLCVKG